MTLALVLLHGVDPAALLRDKRPIPQGLEVGEDALLSFCQYEADEERRPIDCNAQMHIRRQCVRDDQEAESTANAGNWVEKDQELIHSG